MGKLTAPQNLLIILGEIDSLFNFNSVQCRALPISRIT